MSNSSQGNGRRGIAAEYGLRKSLPVFVAPSTDEAFNTLRKRLLPIACWRLEDLHFDFDSSFVKPESAADFRRFASLWKRAGAPTVSVFGHADPVGDDDYNKKLSGRRATAVYAALTRNASLWEDLYGREVSGDSWGMRSIQAMLVALGYDAGPPTGSRNAKTDAAVTAFQTDHQDKIKVDGKAGPLTRQELFLAYMDFLCRDEDDQPFALAPTDFLGGGEDPDGKADRQGCSELNPLFVFSKDQSKQLSSASRKAERDTLNQPNRRVLLFLFPAGTHVSPTDWPCPRTGEGITDCKKQFWPDGDARRNPQDSPREYAISRNTFACRFYDGMARRSPCEVMRKVIKARLLDSDKHAIPKARYRLSAGTHDIRENVADESGRITEVDVLAPSRVTLEWGAPEEVENLAGAFPYQSVISLDLVGDDEADARKRLHNLGYAVGPDLKPAIAAFQQDYGLTPNGDLDDDTRDTLTKAHDTGIASDEV
jgi:peptidoglycan hydrolase-like protein with peptidoglycan-binding domain